MRQREPPFLRLHRSTPALETELSVPEDLIAADERRGAEISATALPEEIPLAAPPNVQPLEPTAPGPPSAVR